MDWDIFTTEGRVSRVHYLIYLAVISLAAGIAGVVAEAIGGFVAFLIVATTFIGQGWSTFSVMVRRAHDAGRSAMYVIWSVIVGAIGFCGAALAIVLVLTSDPWWAITTIVSGILILVSVAMTVALFFWPPDGDNEWGVDPR